VKVDWFGFEREVAKRRIRTAMRSKYNRKSLLTHVLDEAEAFKSKANAAIDRKLYLECGRLAWHFLKMAGRITA